jgi:predicted nucleic acid-binding protein
MPMLRVICNTSPIIGLISIGRLDLLWNLFDEVIIPKAVYDELSVESMRFYAQVEEIEEAVSKGLIIVYTVINEDSVKTMYGRLHFGELEVIVGAKELGIEVAVIDERAARKMASQFLIKTIGILGILLMAKRKGLLNTIREDIDALRDNGYRISESLCKEILHEAGE